MGNSFIIGCLARLWAAVMSFFESSMFCRLQRCVAAVWTKVSDKSFFVNLFKTYPVTDAAFRSSTVYKICSGVFHAARRLCGRIAAVLRRGCVFCTVVDYYKYFLHHSVRAYGMYAVPAALVCLVWGFVTGGLAGTYITLLCVILAVGAAAIAVDKSLYALFANSCIARALMRLCEQQPPVHKDTRANSSAMLAAHLIAGVATGAVMCITGSPLVVVVVAALLCAGFVLYDYRIGIFLALLAMPFAPTMGVVALVMVSFVCFVIKLLFDSSYSFRHTPLDAPLAIFALIMLISSVASFAAGNSIKIFMVYFAFVLAYYLTVNAVRTKAQLYALICGMLFAGAVVALYGIYQHIFGFAEGTTWTDTQMFEDIETRVVSTFDNPNVLGEYLLLLIPVAAGYILARPHSFNKAVSLVVTGLLSLCMIYTYSRGNWIGLIVAILLFFMFYDGRVVWLGIIFALFVPMLLPQNVIDRFMSIGNTADTSTSYRVSIWMGTFAMLRDYWLSGIGLGSEAFNMIYPFYSYSGIVAPHTHNLYLQIITENGIVGLVVFVALILLYYRMCISSIITAKGDKMLRATITGLAAGMFGYLVQGMFDNVWYNYRIVFMFYIILALTSCAVLAAKKEATE